MFQNLINFRIFFLHREEFDEEKEPDGMVLSGWTQSPPDKKDDKKPNGNDVEEISEGSDISGKKRKALELSNDAVKDLSGATEKTGNHKKVQKIDDEDDDDDLVMLDHWDKDGSKRKRLQ